MRSCDGCGRPCPIIDNLAAGKQTAQTQLAADYSEKGPFAAMPIRRNSAEKREKTRHEAEWLERESACRAVAAILAWVAAHGATVILSATKNLSPFCGSDEIRRYAKNDGIFPIWNSYLVW